MRLAKLPKIRRSQIPESGVISVPSITVADSREPGMLRSLRVVTCVVALSCAGCSSPNTDPAPTVTPSPIETTDPTPSTTPSSTPSPEPTLKGFTAEESAAFDAAVASYDKFAQRSDRYYAAGATTNAAKKFFQRFSVDWSRAWGDLAQVANSGVTVTGSTKTVSTKPLTIELDPRSVDVVVLRRCLDESGRVVTQGDTVIDQPQLVLPHFYTIRMEQRPDESRWRSGVAEQEGTC